MSFLSPPVLYTFKPVSLNLLRAFLLLGHEANIITGEESFLISFFGDDYVQYRRSTLVGIPGIP